MAGDNEVKWLWLMYNVVILVNANNDGASVLNFIPPRSIPVHGVESSMAAEAVDRPGAGAIVAVG
jgi:hypothetical protein